MIEKVQHNGEDAVVYKGIFGGHDTFLSIIEPDHCGGKLIRFQCGKFKESILIYTLGYGTRMCINLNPEEDFGKTNITHEIFDKINQQFITDLGLTLIKNRASQRSDHAVHDGFLAIVNDNRDIFEWRRDNLSIIGYVSVSCHGRHVGNLTMLDPWPRYFAKEPTTTNSGWGITGKHDPFFIRLHVNRSIEMFPVGRSFISSRKRYAIKPGRSRVRRILSKAGEYVYWYCVSKKRIPHRDARMLIANDIAVTLNPLFARGSSADRVIINGISKTRSIMLPLR